MSQKSHIIKTRTVLAYQIKDQEKTVEILCVIRYIVALLPNALNDCTLKPHIKYSREQLSRGANVFGL